MRYVEPIYRPGSTESNSYLLQIAMGCAHNQCTFCSFFKEKPFRTRPFHEIEEDLEMARKYFPYDPPVFLIDGEATCYSMDKLRPILQKVHETFPNSPHTNFYARFDDISKRYTVDDLKEMKSLNVKDLYIGLESGSDKVLAGIKKGVTQAEILDASEKMHEAGIRFGMSMILGLGGVEDSEEHVRETIKVLNAIQPMEGVGLLALNPQYGTPLYDDILNGRFELPTYRQILKEEKEILEGLDFHYPVKVYSGIFMPGNSYVAGVFPDQKNDVLRAVENRRFPENLLDKKVLLNGGL